MKRKNTRFAIFLPLLLAVTLVLGMFLGNLLKNNTSSQLPMKVFATSDKISSILNFIQKNYVDSVDREELTEELIRPLLQKLDPHSIYIPPRDLESVNETLRGNFDGIGVSFNMQNDTVLVIQAIKEGPSDQVGILPFDRIISVNGDPIAGVKMPEDSIISRLKGPRGSEVTVGVFRKSTSDTLSFDVKRGVIPVYSIDVAYMMTPEIGYIKINTFSQTTYNEFTTHLSRLKDEGCKNLILDLRNNTGGIMDPAIKIADEFLEKDMLIVYTEGRARNRTEYTASSNLLGEGVELAVLIDEGSASASEIVAGAIQDNDRGWIIGRRSFGKGLVQEQAVLNDGSALRLTTARYYTPTGRSIQKSYSNGLNDYYLEISQRYQHGEFLAADSIEFNDSLKYTTPGGRTVYGGGGIMPDYFVPYDTAGITPFFIRLNRSGLIYQYALKYSDEHYEFLSDLTTAEQISDYLDTNKALDHFKTYIGTKGFHPDSSEWSESTLIVSSQLKAYIARNIIDNIGFYPIIKAIDNTLNMAEDFFQSEH